MLSHVINLTFFRLTQKSNFIKVKDNSKNLPIMIINNIIYTSILVNDNNTLDHFFFNYEQQIISFSQSSSPFFEIRETKRKGRGLFVVYNDKYKDNYKFKNNSIFLKKNIEVTTYGGKIWYIDDWRKRKHAILSKIDDRKQFNYSLQVSDFFLIDAWDFPSDKKDCGHLINHTQADKANTKFFIQHKNYLHPHIKTIDEIEVNSELKIHYSDYFDDLFYYSSSDECNCETSDSDYVNKKIF